MSVRQPRRAPVVVALLAAILITILVVRLVTGPDFRIGADDATSPPQVPATGEGVDPNSGLAYVTLGSLPVEARRTVELIDRGGPFPYEKDGAVFSNREGLLPKQQRGYYREYTVPTPREDDRGARRIVAGRGTQELYWTADHYASFSRIRR